MIFRRKYNYKNKAGNLMNISCENGNLILSDADSFILSHIFDCGQCFRWNMNEDKSFTGVAKGRVVKISQEENNIIFHSKLLLKNFQ